ncbi:Fumarylacetoacetate (FAA) hydrolase family [Teratosphaeria destructans]|uniref:Fumarylacetoacetate (FAA) hydrolase family n=1 Tax=Teratosphaeria destructans TaxID=418781 RepID=A0A9W7W1F1_9PEZI|nr:Fumarylacetoacetate (FAA) hydrolase family [Teratosphaeria destructans]
MTSLQEIKQNCRKVVCIGRNYADHVTELNNQRPKQPFYFLKPSTSILLPNEGPILRPSGVNLHFEIELGLVVGKEIKDLDTDDEQEILSYIDAWLLTIDMTGRNVQEEAKKKGYPWSIAKGFDTFLPINGPISKEKLGDPHNVEIYLKVNGETKQQDNTELMLFRIPRQLSDISKVMTLQPGDIVLTGTPKGVGPVTSGDVIDGGIKVGGKEIEEAHIRVPIEDKGGKYQYAET